MKTDNELIAEFMGETDDVIGPGGPYEYHLFWDRLMPVVEKISQHVYESYSDNNGYKDVVVHDRAYLRTFGMIDSDGKWMVRINRMPLEQGDTLIQATHKAIVEFIKSSNK